MDHPRPGCQRSGIGWILSPHRSFADALEDVENYAKKSDATDLNEVPLPPLEQSMDSIQPDIMDGTELSQSQYEALDSDGEIPDDVDVDWLNNVTEV